MKRKVGRPKAPSGQATYVRLPETDRAALLRLSREEDRPVAALIRAAIREYLDRHTAAA